MATEPAEADYARDLVARVCAQTPGAEAELVAHYRARLMYVVSRRLHDASQTEDIVNEAFITALTKLREGPISAPEKLGGFLFGIARNHILNLHKKQSRIVVSDPDMLAEITSNPGEQEQTIAMTETSRLVRTLIGEVGNDEYRELLVRYYVEDQDKSDICAAMGFSSIKFNQMLYKAKQNLKKIMQQLDINAESIHERP